MNKNITFGSYVSDARKEANLSQKELAQLVKREDGESISPQYLNDIERDRRTPSSDHLIEEFAKALKLDTAYLHYISDKMPPELRDKYSDNEFEGVMKSFRKKIK